MSSSKSMQVMCKIPQNIKQIAIIGGGGRIDPLLNWEGCRKSLAIKGLSRMHKCDRRQTERQTERQTDRVTEKCLRIVLATQVIPPNNSSRYYDYI